MVTSYNGEVLRVNLTERAIKVEPLDIDKAVKYIGGRGAGTRILFDYTLKQNSMTVEEINGYEKEYATHMAVAISVKSGVADTGLGVYSAAKAMELDFIPLANERYDFLIPAEYLDDERVQQFIGILSSDAFKQRLIDLGGYDVTHTGEVRIIE